MISVEGGQVRKKRPLADELCWGLELEEACGGHSGELGFSEESGVVTQRFFECKEKRTERLWDYL